VEEIVPVFSHTLVLRDGAVLAEGPKASVLKSAILSRAFGTPMRLASRGGRYQLSVRLLQHRVA
jgi:iron complex transport system ATP-binding protein